jgi:hypothetical protein
MLYHPCENHGNGTNDSQWCKGGFGINLGPKTDIAIQGRRIPNSRSNASGKMGVFRARAISFQKPVGLRKNIHAFFETMDTSLLWQSYLAKN